MSPPPSTDAASSDPGDQRGLVFNWQSPHAPRWRLGFFLIVAAAAHIAFFYLFRVVYPQPDRPIPSPEQITILSPSNPLARPILAQVADRVSALVAGDSPTLELANLSTKFVPSFKNFDLTLRIPPEVEKRAELPELLVPGESVFPPLAVASPNAVASGGSKKAEPKLTLGGALSGRRVLRDPVWDPEALAQLPERRFRFIAGFDARGRPAFILPLDSPGNPDAPKTLAALESSLKSLLVAPAPNPSSGTLEVTW